MTDMQTWYAALNKPNWAPEPKVFGIAWGLIYPIIFVSFGLVFWGWVQGQISNKIAFMFLLNLALNLSFTWVQFGLRNQMLSLIWMVLIVITLLWAVKLIYPMRPLIAWVQVPYLLWGLFATGLQIAIWWKN